MARLSWAAGILIGITIAVGPRLLPRLRGPEVVRLGHAFYVLSGRRLDVCWAIRLISVDVRGGGDVNPWLAPLPFQGMEFGMWPGGTSSGWRPK